MLLLACSGLERVGLAGRIHKVFTLEEMIPSAGQGILSIQGRKGEDYSWLQCADDPISRIQATAERAFVAALDGGCSSPIAAYAQVSGQQVRLTGLYYHEPAGAYLIGSRWTRRARRSAGRTACRGAEGTLPARLYPGSRRGQRRRRAVRWKNREKFGWWAPVLRMPV